MRFSFGSLLLEWSAGYGPRYGITHVNYETLVRTPKLSAFYLEQSLKSRRGGNI
jgi:beta-glucosidase